MHNKIFISADFKAKKFRRKLEKLAKCKIFPNAVIYSEGTDYFSIETIHFSIVRRELCQLPLKLTNHLAKVYYQDQQQEQQNQS